MAGNHEEALTRRSVLIGLACGGAAVGAVGLAAIRAILRARVVAEAVRRAK